MSVGGSYRGKVNQRVGLAVCAIIGLHALSGLSGMAKAQLPGGWLP